MQGTRVPLLVREYRTYPEATKRESHNYWAYMPKGDALQQEKPPQWEAHIPQWRVAPRESLCTATKTQSSKKKKNYK